MAYIQDRYNVIYNGKTIGSYYTFNDGKASYTAGWGCPWDLEEELQSYGLAEDINDSAPLPLFTGLIQDVYRVPGRRQIIYENGPFRLEREPRETNERYSVYRRAAEEGDPDYSPLRHDAPHREGPGTPEDMREWASWYAFVKMDDGNYGAELDEAWWWGGGHNDGGTIRRIIPEEWFGLPYDRFLEQVVTLCAAAHYGFTADMLKKKDGLKEFFGFSEEGTKE